MSYAIRCRDLVKHYPVRPPVQAVNGLNLEVARGECFGLLGPNGAGKTTTIEILEGLLAPSSGDVEILGQRWNQASQDLRQRLGITLQETRLADKLTVREVAVLFRSFYERGLEPMAVLDKVGLVEKQDAYVSRLSGGQKQRLAIACALVGDPELLFLDEPTTGLDPQSRRQLWDIIRDLKSQGRTILLTTHYMDEAEKLCDRVAIVDQGRVIALGTPAELIARVGGEHLIEFAVEESAEIAVAELTTIEDIVRAVKIVDGYQVAARATHTALPALLNWLEARHLTLAHLSTRHASLEDVFVTLTGRHLRDQDS